MHKEIPGILTTRLHVWLVELPADAPLPTLAEIAQHMGDCDVRNVSNALGTLHDQRRITTRHGTRHEHRGEYAVRVRANGRVHRTANAPAEWIV